MHNAHTLSRASLAVFTLWLHYISQHPSGHRVRGLFQRPHCWLLCFFIFFLFCCSFIKFWASFCAFACFQDGWTQLYRMSVCTGLRDTASGWCRCFSASGQRLDPSDIAGSSVVWTLSLPLYFHPFPLFIFAMTPATPVEVFGEICSDFLSCIYLDVCKLHLKNQRSHNYLQHHHKVWAATLSHDEHFACHYWCEKWWHKNTLYSFSLFNQSRSLSPFSDNFSDVWLYFCAYFDFFRQRKKKHFGKRSMLIR